MELHPYARAFADRDLDATGALLTDDVVFHSPVISDRAFHGKAATRALFEVVFREVEVERCIHGWMDAEAAMSVADARVRGKRVKVANLLELDAEGRVREIWIMARPLVGVVAIAEAMGAGLSRREVPRLAPAMGAGMKPLAAMAASIDRIGARIVRSVNRSATSG